MVDIFSSAKSAQRAQSVENTLRSIISFSCTCYKSLVLKVTSAKTSVKSIPEELAEQQNSKHPIHARKESGASAQTSASAQIWDPNENNKNQTTSFYPYDYFKPLYEPSLKPKRSCGLKKTFETNERWLNLRRHFHFSHILEKMC